MIRCILAIALGIYVGTGIHVYRFCRSDLRLELSREASAVVAVAWPAILLTTAVVDFAKQDRSAS